MIHILGNTYCLEAKTCYIPFYKINEKEIIMLDSGHITHRTEVLEPFLEKTGFSVSGIINTHSHVDHIANNTYLRKKFNTKIAMPKLEAFTCHNLETIRNIYSNYTQNRTLTDLSALLSDVDIEISENTTEMDFLGVHFKFVYTPGHSIAHTCVITPDGVCYAGDVLMGYEGTGAVRFPYSFNLQKDLLSKEQIKKVDCEKFIAAHKGIYRNVEAIADMNIAYWQERMRAFYHMIDGKYVFNDLVEKIYNEYWTERKSVRRFRYLERIVGLYIDYLIDENLVREEFDCGKLYYCKV